MQKEIKFRLWYQKSKKYKYPTDSIFPGDCYIDDLRAHRNRGIVIQQYIGLQDKNGKDIYDGDILKYSGSFVREMNFRVEDSGDRAAWCLVAGNMFMMFEEFMDFCDSDKIEFKDAFEIIGNIFENPDMIK